MAQIFVSDARGTDVGAVFSHRLQQAADGDERRIGIEERGLSLEACRPHQVIVVDSRYVIAARFCNATIERSDQAFVLLLDDMHAAVASSDLAKDFTCTIRASVIDDDQLEFGERLPQDRTHGFGDEPLSIVGCDDYGNLRRIHLVSWKGGSVRCGGFDPADTIPDRHPQSHTTWQCSYWRRRCEIL